MTEKGFPTLPNTLTEFFYFWNYTAWEIQQWGRKRENEWWYFFNKRYNWAIDRDRWAWSWTCAYLNTCIMKQVNAKNIMYWWFFHTPEWSQEEYSSFFANIIRQSVHKSPQSKEEPLKILFTWFPAFARISDNPTARYLFNDSGNTEWWWLQDWSKWILWNVLEGMWAEDIKYNPKNKSIEATIEGVKVQLYTAKLPVDDEITTQDTWTNNLPWDWVQTTLSAIIEESKPHIVVWLWLEYKSNKFILEANTSPWEVPQKINSGFLDFFDIKIPKANWTQKKEND